MTTSAKVRFCIATLLGFLGWPVCIVSFFWFVVAVYADQPDVVTPFFWFAGSLVIGAIAEVIGDWR